jgi:hypothetical protein
MGHVRNKCFFFFEKPEVKMLLQKSMPILGMWIGLIWMSRGTRGELL